MHDDSWYIRIYYQPLFNEVNTTYPYDSIDIELYQLLPRNWKLI